MRCARCKAADGGARMCVDCLHELREGKKDGDEIAHLFEQARALLQRGDLTPAIRVLQRLLRRDAGHLACHESLILVYGMLDKFDRAFETFLTMHRLAHVGPVVKAMKLPPTSAGRKRASRTCCRLHTSSEADPGDLHDNLGLALFYRQLGQLDLAERLLSRIMASDDVAPEAHLILGSVYRAQGKARPALAELKKARTGGGTEHAGLAYEMGLCHEMLGQLKKAHTFVSAAISLEPDNPHMHFSLGMLYEKQGRPRLARRAYRVASSLNQAFAPALVDISFRLGLAALDEENLERALSEFNAGVSENPHLFAPAILNEVDHLIGHLIEVEQFRTFMEAASELKTLPDKALADLEDAFALAARLAFFVGLQYYWDGYYETQAHESGEVSDVYGPVECPAAEVWQYEPVEPQATWLEGVGPGGRMLRGASVSPWRGRRPQKSGLPLHATVKNTRASEASREPKTVPCNLDAETIVGPCAAEDERLLNEEAARVRAQMSRAETMLGFPPVQFEFIFEEWLNVLQTLASPRVAERPLVSPDTYQRLLSILSAALQRARAVLESHGVTLGNDSESQDSTDLGTSLWATVIESYLVRNALERCRSYPREVLVRLATSDRYRQRGLFSRTIRELEAAVPLMAENTSVHNFLWNLYIREGQYQEAIDHCHVVLRSTPHYLFQAAAYNDLAYCMVELGQNLNLALLYTEKARELAPQLFDGNVADTMAWLCWKQGRFEEALHHIEQVIEAGYADDHALMPTSIHFYHYGHILQALGRDVEAQDAFSRAVEMEVDAESDWGIARRLQKERKQAR